MPANKMAVPKSGRIALLVFHENVRPQQAQIHQTRIGNAGFSPLRDGAFGHFAHPGELAGSAKSVDDFVVIDFHETKYRELAAITSTLLHLKIVIFGFMSTTLAERIAIVIAELKTTQSGLAKIVGVTKGAVNQWTGGKPESGISAASAFRLEDKTPFRARWISTGEGPKYKTEGAREAALIELYRACDERGKAQIYRAAESESVYAATKDDRSDAA